MKKTITSPLSCQPSMRDDLKTFQEWSEDGYQILKGSKATWVDGVAMFSQREVSKSTRPKRAASGNQWIGCAPKGTGGNYITEGPDEYRQSEGYGDEWSLF